MLASIRFAVLGMSRRPGATARTPFFRATRGRSSVCRARPARPANLMSMGMESRSRCAKLPGTRAARLRAAVAAKAAASSPANRTDTSATSTRSIVPRAASSAPRSTAAPRAPTVRLGASPATPRARGTGSRSARRVREFASIAAKSVWAPATPTGGGSRPSVDRARSRSRAERVRPANSSVAGV